MAAKCNEVLNFSDLSAVANERILLKTQVRMRGLPCTGTPVLPDKGSWDRTVLQALCQQMMQGESILVQEHTAFCIVTGTRPSSC